MEALRYTDADPNYKKKTKKSKGGASLYEMALANLWRNRKRTVMVICSLTLGLVLMSFFYAKNASFDVEKYLMDLTVADYEIDDATNNISSGYDPASQTINDELLSDIEALGTVEQTGRLYSRQVNFTINEQTRNNLKTYYTRNGWQSLRPMTQLSLHGKRGLILRWRAKAVTIRSMVQTELYWRQPPTTITFYLALMMQINLHRVIIVWQSARRLKPETIFQPILLGKKSKYQTGSLRLWLC